MQIQKNTNLISEVSLLSQPTEGQKYIFQKNIQQLLTLVISNATEFQSPTLNKFKAIQQLKQIICIADVQQHLTLIFNCLIKQFVADDNAYQQEIRKICFIIGLKVEADYYLPTMINLAQFELQSQNVKNLTSCLHILSETIQHESDNLEIQEVIHLMMDIDNIFQYSVEVMDGIFKLLKRIIVISQNNITIYVRQMFQLILSIKSLNMLNNQYQLEIQQTLEILAHKCGYSSVTDLHTNEVNLLLDQICQQEQYKHWKHTSKEFYKFKAIIQGCGDGISKFMNQIVQIMKYCLQPEQEVEMRLEVLLLLDNIVQIKSIQQTIKLFAYIFFNQLIIPSMIWKVGKPNVKTRKAAVIIAIQLIDLLSSQEINEMFSSIVAPLKSCLTDDWAPDVRYASTKLSAKLMAHQLEYQYLSDFYPALLERLDDSQNPIRIESSIAIGNLLQQEKLQQSAIVEYVIKGVLVHLDDQSEDVQKSIYECLQKCKNKHLLQKECEGVVNHFKYPRLCQELIKYCKEEEHQ